MAEQAQDWTKIWRVIDNKAESSFDDRTGSELDQNLITELDANVRQNSETRNVDIDRMGALQLSGKSMSWDGDCRQGLDLGKKNW